SEPLIHSLSSVWLFSHQARNDPVVMLTKEQEADYNKNGYLLVSGLIPPETAAAAEAAMWRLLGVSPSDPAAWAELPRGHGTHESPELVACYTPEFLAAAAQLAGDDLETVRAPRRGYAINIFPVQGEWRWPAPHIDHA